MKAFVQAALAVAALALSACSTSQQVMLAKQAPPRVVTVAQVPDDGNSPEMDAYVRSALVKQGFSVRSPLPAGTRKSSEVDAIVSYVDVWRWDLVMYLQSIAIKMFDARTGDLLVTGDWKNSAFHGYPDEGEIVGQIVGEMAGKLDAAAPAAPVAEVPASEVPESEASGTAD